jgi:hypothetical protein
MLSDQRRCKDSELTHRGGGQSRPRLCQESRQPPPEKSRPVGHKTRRLAVFSASGESLGERVLNVPNHVGPGHPWVGDEPTPDWFHGTRANHSPATFDFSALINPHAPERDRVNTLHGWFANALPDMNTDDPIVAQYLRQRSGGSSRLGRTLCPSTPSRSSTDPSGMNSTASSLSCSRS